MGSTQSWVFPFFLARGLKPTALTALVNSKGMGNSNLLGYDHTKARLVGRDQAFEFLEPVEDDDQFRRHEILLTLDH